MDQDLKNNILKSGTTIIGIVCKDGVVMASDRRATAGNLIAMKNAKKAVQINDYLVIAGTGNMSDIEMQKKIIAAQLKLKELKSIKINCKELISGFKSVWYSASNSNIKPELSSVFIYKEDGTLVFVSTDSFRLAEKKVNTKSPDFPQTLIPFKNVSEIIKLFEDYNNDINIIFEKNQAAFITPEIYVVSRLIDGSFPDYKQIIPKSDDNQVLQIAVFPDYIFIDIIIRHQGTDR